MTERRSATAVDSIGPLPDTGEGHPLLPTAYQVRRDFGLTCRESEVALLLARGLSAKRIAVELKISWHTARGHIEKVLRKLSAGSQSQVGYLLLCGKPDPG